MESCTINLLEVGAKAQRKTEMYRALVVEGGLYLPPQKETSMLFISQIATDEKKVLKAKDVIVCTIPHVEGLRTKDLINFLVEECNGTEYLPDNYIDHQPNRTWIANLFKSGRSHHLLKRAITNKKKTELRLEQEQKDLMLKSTALLTERIEDLKRELAEKEKIIEDHQADSDILNDLYSKGYIDKDGNITK